MIKMEWADGIRPMQKRPLKPVGAGLVPAHPAARGGKAKPGESDPDAATDNG